MVTESNWPFCSGSKGCCCITVAWCHTRLCKRTRFMCSSSAPSVGGNLLLSASCLQSKFHLKSGILVIRTPTSSKQTSPVHLSLPVLDHLHLVVSGVLWVSPRQLSCITETILFCLFLRISQDLPCCRAINICFTPSIINAYILN